MFDTFERIISTHQRLMCPSKPCYTLRWGWCYKSKQQTRLDFIPNHSNTWLIVLVINMQQVSSCTNHCSTTIKLPSLMRPEPCDLHRPSGFRNDKKKKRLKSFWAAQGPRPRPVSRGHIMSLIWLRLSTYSTGCLSWHLIPADQRPPSLPSPPVHICQI